MKSINPYTEEEIAHFDELSESETQSKIELAQESFLSWKETSPQTRALYFKSLNQVLNSHKMKYANLITSEMGKPISEAVAEIEKCIKLSDYYIEYAEEFLEAQSIEHNSYARVYTHFTPLGVILGVMPWNFPFWQVMRFAIPTIMAGNTVLLKHASSVSGCSKAIEEAFKDAHFNPGIFTSLLIKSDRVKKVIEAPQVKAVSFTGSAKAGSSVATHAGASLKKCVLELGGSDPYIILEDADLLEAAKICLKSRLVNNGQSCIGAKRLIIVTSVYEEFKKVLIEEAENFKSGDPLNQEVDLGPMSSSEAVKKVRDQVRQSLESGAKIIYQAQILKKGKCFYPLTILDNVTPDSVAYRDEIFGPVVSLIRVESCSEAVKVANDTDFGLGAAIFTKNLSLAHHLAAYDIEAGSCFINDFVKSDPKLPFGGINQSGFGRELAKEGIREFVNLKTICQK